MEVREVLQNDYDQRRRTEEGEERAPMEVMKSSRTIATARQPPTALHLHRVEDYEVLQSDYDDELTHFSERQYQVEGRETFRKDCDSAIPSAALATMGST